MLGSPWSILNQSTSYGHRLFKELLFYIQLHVAAANAYEEVLEFLLENDADVDVEDKDGWKPIHAAACWGNVSLIRLINATKNVPQVCQQ